MGLMGSYDDTSQLAGKENFQNLTKMTIGTFNARDRE